MSLKLIAIGALGTMLSPSAKHLKNQEVTTYLRVLDRGGKGTQKDQRRQAWRDYGAKLVGNLQDLIGEGDFDGVVICAGKNGDDYHIFKELVSLLSVSKREYFILHLSTVSCHFVEATHAFCAQAKIKYVNYPLTGGAKGAEAGKMLILASGDGDLYARLEPMLQCIGTPKYFGTNVANGAAVKLLNHILVFHGLLGISLAAVLHKNINHLAQLDQQQVEFFDFLNQGAGGTKQWDVALRQALANHHWHEGFAVRYAVIDILYTIALMLEKNLPAILVLPLLEIALLFAYLLKKTGDNLLATQAIAQLIAEAKPNEIERFIQHNLSFDIHICLNNCIAALPADLQKVLMLEVRY
jgi:3-hydroxyisobutyrate dehydrogenase-like beta-hydroxyacid dehydrogenase